MAAGLVRIISCMLLFGWGTEAPAPGVGQGVAVILSGIVALAINPRVARSAAPALRQRAPGDRHRCEELRLPVGRGHSTQPLRDVHEGGTVS